MPCALLKNSRVSFSWKADHGKFRTGLSLHRHTLHSRETMDFVSRTTTHVPWLGSAIRKQEELYYKNTGRKLNLKNAWWTPPLSPRRAWELETSQVENALGASALVSLS